MNGVYSQNRRNCKHLNRYDMDSRHVFTIENTPNKVCAGGSGNGYRYGFNGQEKDDEVYGEANAYNAEFWEYDPRLGRRWNMDPKPRVWESPYACFGNNPIINRDPKGDTLRTDGASLSATDLKSLAGKYSHFVSVDSKTNEVTIDYMEGKNDSKYYNKKGVFNEKKYNKDIANSKFDKGIQLLTDLSTSSDNYFYGTGTSYSSTDRVTGKTYTTPLGNTVISANGPTTQWFRSLSRTPYNSTWADDAPATGYDGQVTIMPGRIQNEQTKYDRNGNPNGTTVVTVSRASYVYHELREVFLRTNGSGMSYDAAHKQAKIDEGQWYGNEFPGEFVNFTK